MAAKPGTTKGRVSTPSKLFGSKNGRASSKESLMPGQMTTTTPGDPVSRAQGQYGKDHNAYLPEEDGMGGPSSMPTMMRNMSGGIRDRPRSGGLDSKFQRAPEVPF